MAPNLPSSLQVAYAEELSTRVNEYLIGFVVEQQKQLKRDMAPTSSQVPPIPASALYAWSGEAAEKLRRLVLAYYKETGLYPD